MPILEEKVSVTRARMAQMQIDAQTNGPEKESGIMKEGEITINKQLD